MQNNVLCETLQILLKQMPEAWAKIKGDSDHSSIMGLTTFYPLWRGSLVVTSISGLPKSQSPCRQRFYAFHLHEGNSCTGHTKDPFANSGMHWNPSNCQHPSHAGDFPPFIENEGYALNIFYTENFYPEEIVGKTLIVHDMIDNFTSQPSGDSGMKIACGEICSNDSLKKNRKPNSLYKNYTNPIIMIQNYYINITLC